MPPSTTIDPARLLAETFVRRAEVYAELGSTNDQARQLAAQPGPLPLLVVAQRQTAGRGRATHRWWSGQGGLTFSLLVGPDLLPRRRTPLVSLAAAVAVVETLRPLAPSHVVGLHWPNDVLVSGEKTAGILIEILPQGHGVLGIGINTNNRLADGAPEDVCRTAATLCELTGQATDHTALLVELLRRLQGVLATLQAEPGQIAAQAHAHCLQCGQNVRILSARRVVEGCCAGIGADGALLVDTPQGRAAIHSGVGAA